MWFGKSIHTILAFWDHTHTFTFSSRLFSIIRNINQTLSIMLSVIITNIINNSDMLSINYAWKLSKKSKTWYEIIFQANVQNSSESYMNNYVGNWVQQIFLLIILCMLNHVIFPTEEKYFFWLYVYLALLVISLSHWESSYYTCPQCTHNGLLCLKSSTAFCTFTVCIFLFMKSCKTLICERIHSDL